MASGSFSGAFNPFDFDLGGLLWLSEPAGAPETQLEPAVPLAWASPTAAAQTWTDEPPVAEPPTD